MAERNLNSKIYVEFTDPDTRDNIVSGEEIKTIMGKIHKQFADMNSVAYSGSYDDLSGKPVIDSALSSTSTNAVQNKVIKAELDKKSNTSHTHKYAGSASVGGPATTALSSTKATQDSQGQQIDTTYIKNISSDGTTTVTFTKGDGTTGTFNTKDTTYSAATTSKAGLMSATDKSKLDGITASADSVSFTRSLTSGTKVGTIKINGTNTDLYCQTNTHYASKNVVGSNTATSNTTTALTNGNVYLNSVENGAVTSTHKISGSGATSVTTDASGNIVVSSTNTTYSAATTSKAGLMSASDKAKLDGIEEGAQVNTVTGVKGNSESAYRTGNINITKANIGLSNVENKTSATIRGEITSANVTTALGYTPAELDSDGKVLASQLPSFVDDVLEYESNDAFPETGESGKIYVNTTNNKTYRWSGTSYVEISASLALGETSSTAYRGDRGKIAYDHSQKTSGNPHNVSLTDLGVTATSTELNYVDGVTSNIQTQLNNKAASSHTHSAYVNQNAFSNVTVGSTTVSADNATDTLTLVAGSNITLTPDATNDKITIASKDTTYSAATTSKAGLMSASDKAKLDGIEKGANKITVDSALNTTSTNPVQNMIVTTALNKKVDGCIQLTNEDLDSIKPTVATFYYAGGSNTCTNNPGGSGQAFGLIAYKSANGYVTQELISQSGVKMYRFHNASAWSPWKTIADSSYLKSLSINGNTITYRLGNGTTGTLTTQDTTYSAATTSTAGLMSASDKSKLDAITASADSVSISRSLTSGTKSATITINGTSTDLYCQTNTDTHYTSKNVVGSNTATSNTTTALTNGNVYLNSVENGAVTSSHKISGSGATTVTTDASGNIVISSTDNNTTYSAATTSKAGLMSASDKSKLDAITASADSVSFTRSLTSGTKVGTITINGTNTDLYCQTNTDTHYTSKNVVGSNIATSNTTTALTNGNVYLNSVENGAVTSTHKISGSGATTVTTDTSGNIVVSSTNTTYSAATTSKAGLMSASDKSKLDGIEEGAQVNTVTGIKGSSESAYRTGNVNITKANIGLSNVENKTSATIRGEITSANVTTALGYTPAELDSDGKVLASQLPSFVDDVLEYDDITAFPETGESGKIYVNTTNNKTYRWSGTSYVEISASLALGETSSTAYRGDRGKIAYDHSQKTSGNPHNVSLTDLGVTATSTELNYVDGVTSNIQTQLNSKAASSHTHSAYVNQNAFSNVTVGSTTVAADSATDTLTLVAGSNITLTPDATNDKITIASKDTTYSAATTSKAGLMSASDKSKLDAITASADSVSYTASLTSGTKVGTITINGTNTDLYCQTNTDTHYVSKNVVGSNTSTSNTTTALTNGNVYLNSVENGAVTSTHKISGSGATSVTTDASGNIVVSSTNTTYSAATTSKAGLMSASDKSKLDAITASADSVSYTASLTSGTKVGTITINGTGTDLYCQTNTDTKNTAGSTNTSSKIFLIGATSQATNPQTYSHDTAYVGTDGCLYSNSTKVSVEGHTHNYAGSTSAGGVATSANKLATARTITLNGEVTGSASFDGSADITITTRDKYYTIDSGNTTNYPYHRIIHYQLGSYSYADGDVIFEIRAKYNRGIWCKAKLAVRQNQSGSTSSCNMDVLGCSGNFNVANLVFGFNNVYGSTYIDVFYKCGPYARTVFYIEHMDTGNGTLTTYNSNEVNGTTSKDKLTSTEVYSSVETAGTELYGSDYTYTSTGTATMYNVATYDSKLQNIASTYIKGLSVSGKTITYTKGDATTGTITTQDTTYSAATTSAAGLMSASDKSKLDGITASADSVSISRSLTSGTKIGTIKINGTSTDLYCQTNTDTHYTSKNVVGSNTATSNTTTALTNGNVYLNSVENGAVTSSHKISGSGATSVTTDTSGNIVVSSTNTTYSAATTSKAGLMSASDKSKLDGIATSANNYSLPTASSSTLGGVKTTSTVTSTSGLTACPIISGVPYYKDTNTTYSTATTSANGLMSSSDKSKLDGITASADAVTYTQTLTSGTKVGTININGTDTILYAPTNTDTHYTSKNVVGSNTATSNTTTALTNGNVYLNSVENGAVTSSHKISGSGATTVTTDASGNIVISSTDNNTTYSAATTSKAGLMSASDKSKLDGITTSADSVSYTASLTSGTKVGTIKINGTDTILYAPTNTDTKVTSTTTNPTSATTYYLPFVTGATTGGVKINNGVRYTSLEGTTSANGYGKLILGNSTATGTAANKYGQIDVYSKSSSYGTIIQADTTSAITHTLPATTGTILNTGTTSFTSSLTSGTKVGTIKINGTSTDLYCQTNTDTHYTSKNVVGSNTATSNTTTALTNGNVYLNSVENGAVTSTHKISGSGATSVTTDASGNIVVSSTNTDTKNTAGSTNTSSKIFLIGATSQATNPQTYSHDTAYVGTDGCLYSNSTKVSVEGHTHSYLPLSGGTVTGTVYLTKSQDISGTTTNDGALVIGPSTAEHMLFDGNEIMVKDSSGNPTTININLDGGNIVLGKSGYNVTCNGTLSAQSASTSTAGLVKVDGSTIKISSGVISGVGINKAGTSFNKTYTVGYDDSKTTVSGTVGTASEIFNSASNTVGTGTYAHAEGYLTTAIGNNAHAEGNATVATNSGTHAEGYMTTASGEQAHAEGNRTLASGTQAHAEGYKTKASGSYSHAEGYQTSVSDIGSHVEGCNCSLTGSGYGNHVEGYSNTLADGYGNHVEGYSNTLGSADRYAVHIGGVKCESIKNFSFLHGQWLKVDNSGGLNGLTVVGQYNNNDLSDSTVQSALFIVGNGSYTGTATSVTDYAEDDITRSNAMVVCQSRSNFYNDVYAISNNSIVDRLSGAGGNKGFYIYLNSAEAAGIYSGGSNCYLGSSTKKFYASYITNMYGTVKGTADYAEYMEWSDGNPDNEDRRGLLVTYDIDNIDDDGELKIKLANEGDDIVGIVSSAPVVLGDAYDNEWHGKYQKDIYGSIIYDEIEHEDATEEDRIEYVPRISEDYDENKTYIGRNKRPEWSPIGLLGKLVCIDDGSCVIGKYVTAINGVATLSTERTNMRMIQRIDDTHIKVLIK